MRLLATIARGCGDVLTQLRLGTRAAGSGKTRGWGATSKVTLNRFTSKIRPKMAFSGVFPDFHHLTVVSSAQDLDFRNLRSKLGPESVWEGLLQAATGRIKNRSTGIRGALPWETTPPARIKLIPLVLK